MTRFRNVAFAVMVLVCVGCGSGNPWDPVQVSGKITYEDGSVIPVGGMRLYFMPQTPPVDAKTFPRQGVVGVNTADGSFDKITTYKFADGLIPGKHKVIVAPSERRAGGGSAVTIPKEYNSLSTTPIEIDTADSPIHIKIRKP